MLPMAIGAIILPTDKKIIEKPFADPNESGGTVLLIRILIATNPVDIHVCCKNKTNATAIHRPVLFEMISTRIGVHGQTNANKR